MTRNSIVTRSGLALAIATSVGIHLGCSSSNGTPDGSTVQDANSASQEGGLTVRILKPVDDADYPTDVQIPLKGTAFSATEGYIVDPNRLKWLLVDQHGIINPEGEGTQDIIGPFDAGAYKVRFSVFPPDATPPPGSLAGEQGFDQVNITVR